MLKKVGFAVALSVFFVLEASAANAWYYGKITRLWSWTDDAFIITFDSTALDDCQWDYAYFRKASIGNDQFKNVFALALSAYHADHTVGVVIDKATQPNGTCDAINMDMQKSNP